MANTVCTLASSCTIVGGGSLLWQFLTLLVVHWIADFVLQTHWQASNKNKDNIALGHHVITYTFVLGLVVPLMFPIGFTLGAFVAINGVLHFATDWCTSRVTSMLFLEQLTTLEIVMPPLLNDPMVKPQTHFQPALKKDFSLHWFFVVVGLDQLIHQVTLAGTMVLFFGGGQ